MTWILIDLGYVGFFEVYIKWKDFELNIQFKMRTLVAISIRNLHTTISPKNNDRKKNHIIAETKLVTKHLFQPHLIIEIYA